MSTIDNIAYHASAIRKIVDFVNFSEILNGPLNNKIKLSHSQAIELLARLSGFNTYKGMMESSESNGPNFNKINFDSIIESHFEKHSGTNHQIKLIQMIKVYCENQLWDFKDLQDYHLTFGLKYIPTGRWNDLSRLHLENVKSTHADNPLLQLCDLFVANFLSLVAKKSNNQYELDYKIPYIALTSVPESIKDHVIQSYTSLGAAIISFINKEIVIYNRYSEYLVITQNGEIQDLINDSVREFHLSHPVNSNPHLGTLKDNALSNMFKKLSKTNFVYPQLRGIPQPVLLSPDFKLMLNSISDLNKYKLAETDSLTLKSCPENLSLVAWSSHLIDYYNISMDLVRRYFDSVVTSEKGDYFRFYYNDLGLLAYDTNKNITISMGGQNIEFTPNDFNFAFNFLFSYEIISTKNTIFNMYLHLYYGFLVNTAIKDKVILDEPKKVKLIFELLS
jgi:hypothetical protein